MKKTLITLLGIVLFGAAVAVEKPAGATMEQYVDALMRRMTLEEKIGQLNLPSAGDITTGQAKSSDIAEKIRRGEVGGLFNIKGVEKIRDVQRIAVEESRLGIPLIFGMDVIHGYETTFPIPLGLTATWDMEAVERAARISAVEASAAGICWTFSPMVDIARDPRWGRASEGIGEDPFLGSAVARSFVYGYQGRDPMHFATDEIMGCVKHYALYGAAEAGRDYNTTDMSRQRMYNEYFPPYKAAVEAGVGSVMASFNEVDGIPATANRWLMTTVLREQWGFKGFVVTDYTGIYEMIAHGLGDLKEVSARAVEAGVDHGHGERGLSGNLAAVARRGAYPAVRYRPRVPPGARSEIQVGTFRRSLPLLRSAARRHADLYARTPRRGAPYRGRELRTVEKRRRRAAAPARGNDRRGRPAGRFAREHARHVERRYRPYEAADARRRVAAGGR